MNPIKGTATAREHERRRTKIAQYKCPKRNVESEKDSKVGDGRQKEEWKATKKCEHLK